MSCRKITAALKKKGYIVEDITYSGGEWGGDAPTFDDIRVLSLSLYHEQGNVNTII